MYSIASKFCHLVAATALVGLAPLATPGSAEAPSGATAVAAHPASTPDAMQPTLVARPVPCTGRDCRFMAQHTA